MYKINFLRRWLIRTGLFATLLVPGFSYGQNAVPPAYDKRVHIVVVLADNVNQGIVPIPEKLGDGQSPRTNLYWGALYGVKTYFKRHSRVKTLEPSSTPTPNGVLDQADFVLQTSGLNVHIHAEAWRGDKMRAAINRFYTLLSDANAAELIVFVGHNGLMDSPVMAPIAIAGQPKPGAGKDAIVLACLSESYFSSVLSNIGTRSILMTHGLMAPEAYSLLPAIEKWASGATKNDIRLAAASGYAKYQKIPVRNAQRLFGAKP